MEADAACFSGEGSRTRKPRSNEVGKPGLRNTRFGQTVFLFFFLGGGGGGGGRGYWQIHFGVHVYLFWCSFFGVHCFWCSFFGVQFLGVHFLVFIVWCSFLVFIVWCSYFCVHFLVFIFLCPFFGVHFCFLVFI